MNISYKKQFLLTVIEETISKDESGLFTKKCNKTVDYFDTKKLAFDYLKKYGSSLEKYAITEATTVSCCKIRL